MRKIKILTITTSGLGRKEGISTVILDYYSYFDNEKFELDIIASGDYSYQLVTEFQEIGVNIRCLPSRKVSVAKYIKALIALVRAQKYDSIYIHGSSAIMSIELMIAKFCGCKIRVVHSHNTTCNHKKADKLLRPIFYHSYTQALACGNDAGNWLYAGREFDVIKNGRNVDKYKFDITKRNEVRKQLGLIEDTFVIGHVGNFNEQKNQKYLIGILKEIIALEDNVKLYLMGDGRTKKDIEQLVKDNELSDYVVFTGCITNVPDMLQAMDVMLLPSLYEGLPLVVVEWQIAGLPCILSDTITKECAYTDLVLFMALCDEYSSWAKKVLQFKNSDRGSISEKVVRQTKENGFDLGDNAGKLQTYFCR